MIQFFMKDYKDNYVLFGVCALMNQPETLHFKWLNVIASDNTIPLKYH